MKINTINPQQNLKSTHRKDRGLHKGYKGIVLKDGEFRELVDLRIYWPGQVAYACLWFNSLSKKTETRFHASGSGKASGYGYCKESAAAYEAFESAGIEMEHWGGSGQTKTAVEALTKELAEGNPFHVVEFFA
jgi:hypothetical protein